MKKTTIYLPDDLKAALERLAAAEHRSEADLIREALRAKVAEAHPRPRVPLVSTGLGDPSAAEKVDDLLEEFGRT